MRPDNISNDSCTNWWVSTCEQWIRSVMQYNSWLNVSSPPLFPHILQIMLVPIFELKWQPYLIKLHHWNGIHFGLNFRVDLWAIRKEKCLFGWLRGEDRPRERPREWQLALANRTTANGTPHLLPLFSCPVPILVPTSALLENVLGTPAVWHLFLYTNIHNVPNIGHCDLTTTWKQMLDVVNVKKLEASALH